jgi:hypothetical protein
LVALDREAARRPARAEGELRDRARGPHAPDGGHARQQRVEQGHALRVGRVLGLRERDREGEHAARLEPGVDVLEPGEAAREEPGAGEQHECQGDLRDHEPAPDELRAAVARRAAPALAEGAGERAARRLRRGGEPEKESGA